MKKKGGLSFHSKQHFLDFFVIAKLDEEDDEDEQNNFGHQGGEHFLFQIIAEYPILPNFHVCSSYGSKVTIPPPPPPPPPPPKRL